MTEPERIHTDISGGWLRAATFGAMDGMVSNTALIAGVAASASADTVAVSGIAGLLAGACSMALGEYTSVTTANEQIDAEVEVERRSLRDRPDVERTQLVAMLMQIGVSEPTAQRASEEVHRDEDSAVNLHMMLETGIDPREKPSPRVAALSSFVMFAIGAVLPLLPYLLGRDCLWAGLACAAVGLGIAGALAARFTGKSAWRAAGRQLALGAVAVAVTYHLGGLIAGLI
ncbi:VIT1/CCC1 transporter family protein [Mycobacterium sp. M1]|uniref:VIT1/CCC1 transporter family protein n=1 Tax=Mycolicibacter acidiphilus TaxID=2835306 RepID=A0ABS5RFG9_9MYCO|nr:VIT1/CCC1 transporter family protein [Mycolicibacter acidiphilus]MBS9532722.1 VIT1/CCC1 transporter family protein [Mycolicibacter acidiphilus]